jgi:hypothetical protein
MKQLSGIIMVVFAIVAFLTLSQVEVLAWGINYPGGSVNWGNDRGRAGVGINVPGFKLNEGW